MKADTAMRICRIPLGVIAILLGAVATFAAEPDVHDKSGPVPINVAVKEVDRGPIRSWILTEGTTRAVHRELLQFGRSGKVVEIGLDADGNPLREGSVVYGPSNGKPGQLIARIDARDQSEQLSAETSQAQAAQRRVDGARSAVAQQQSSVTQAEQEYARVEDLAKKGWVARKRLDDAAATLDRAKAQLAKAGADMAAAQAEAKAARSQATQAFMRGEQYEIRAPFDGIIGFLNVTEGDYASPIPTGETDLGRLMRMAAAVVFDPSVYEVVVEIPSFQSLSIQRGMAAQITWGGMNLFTAVDDPPKAAPGGGAVLPIADAVVYAVAPVIAPDSRTVRVRLRTTEGAGHLLDGLYVSVRLLAAERKDALRGRIEAARYEQGRPYVYVVDREKMVAVRRDVRFGVSEGQTIEVLEGLQPGDLVVVSGQERLADGFPVKIVDGKTGS